MEETYPEVTAVAAPRATPGDSTTGASTPREDAVAAAIGTWAVVGLMLDGRAHETGAVESFFTPWHAVLYSGVAAAFAAIGLGARRRRREGASGSAALPTGYRLGAAGALLMAGAGAADMGWHQVFGIEEDLAALLSPTHLLLLIGGLLLLTSPIRAAAARRDAPGDWRELGPALVAVMLSATTVAFFLEFASPFHDAGVFAGGGDHGGPEVGIAGVVVTTIVLLGAVVLPLRWFGRLPLGAATMIFTGVVALLTLASDFAVAGGAVAALLAGVVADALIGRTTDADPLRLPGALAAIPIVLWLAFYGVVAASLELSWDVELWTGSIVLASLAGFGLGVLVTARRRCDALAHRA